MALYFSLKNFFIEGFYISILNNAIRLGEWTFQGFSVIYIKVNGCFICMVVLFSLNVTENSCRKYQFFTQNVIIIKTNVKI